MALSQLGTACAALALALAGCASMPSQKGFTEVRDTVSFRTGARVAWDNGTADDRAANAAVQALLQHELSADEAVQVAYLRNPAAQVTFEDLGIAQADLVQAGLLRNPVFSFEVRFPGRPRLPLELEVSQSFIDLLLLPLRKRVAAARFEAAKLRVADELIQLAADVRAAYYGYQGTQQMIQLRRTTAEAAEASAEAARRMRDAGNLPELALTTELAAQAEARIELRAAEAEAAVSRERLGALLGVSGDESRWTIPARLPEVPAEEIAPEELEARAVASRLDVAAARQEVVIAGQALGITRRFALFDEVEVTGHVEREPNGKTTLGPSVQLPIPLFDRGQAAVTRSEAAFRQARQRYRALTIQARSQARAGFGTLTAARERAEYYRTVLIPLRHKVVEDTQLQFNAMQAGVFQLLEARRAEVDAGRGYVASLRDYWLARNDFARTLGGAGPTPGPTPDVSAPAHTDRSAPPDMHHEEPTE